MTSRFLLFALMIGVAAPAVADAPGDPSAGRSLVHEGDGLTIYWGGECGRPYQSNDVFVYFDPVPASESEPDPDALYGEGDPRAVRVIGSPAYMNAVLQPLQPFLAERCEMLGDTRLLNFSKEWAAFSLRDGVYLADRAELDEAGVEALLADLYGGFRDAFAEDPYAEIEEIGYGTVEFEFAETPEGEAMVRIRERPHVVAASRATFAAALSERDRPPLIAETRALLGTFDTIDYPAIAVAFAAADIPDDLDTLRNLESHEGALRNNAYLGIERGMERLRLAQRAAESDPSRTERAQEMRERQLECHRLMTEFSRTSSVPGTQWHRTSTLQRISAEVDTKTALLYSRAAALDAGDAAAVESVDLQIAASEATVAEAVGHLARSEWRDAAQSVLEFCWDEP